MNINILGTKVHVLLVFVGALCVLLLFGCIGVISWGGWKMNQQDEATKKHSEETTDLKNLTEHLKAENEKLQEGTEKLSKKVENLNEKSQNETKKLSSQMENLNEKLQNETKKLSSQMENLNEKSQKETKKLSSQMENLNEKSQNETEKLSKKVENLNEKLQNETKKLSSQIENLNEKSQKETKNLNQTIQLIQKFKAFLFNEHCNDRECLLCQTGWIFFNESCYFISNVWLTWDHSRRFCQDKSADLIVINNQQEQEFIYGNINTNTDYWLGLRKVGSNWVWIDGRNNTLGFWRWSYPNSNHSYAYMYQTGDPRASWFTLPDKVPDKQSVYYTSYLLCEQKASKLSLN